MKDTMPYWTIRAFDVGPIITCTSGQKPRVIHSLTLSVRSKPTSKSVNHYYRIRDIVGVGYEHTEDSDRKPYILLRIFHGIYPSKAVYFIEDSIKKHYVTLCNLIQEYKSEET